MKWVDYIRQNWTKEGRSQRRAGQYAMWSFAVYEYNRWGNRPESLGWPKDFKKEHGLDQSVFEGIMKWKEERGQEYPLEAAQKLFIQEKGLTDEEREQGQKIFEQWVSEQERRMSSEEPSWVVDPDEAGRIEEQQYMDYEKRMSSPSMERARKEFVKALEAIEWER